MTILKTLPAELLGLVVLVTAAMTRLFFPEVSDFWLALAAAITLFAIMQIRAHVVFDNAAKEKPSP